MALPSRTQQIAEATAVAIEYRVPEIADSYYISMPVLVRLMSKGHIVNGRELWAPFIYDKKNGGWFKQGDSFDISRKETKTSMIFQWASLYAGLTITHDDQVKISGNSAAIDFIAGELDEGEMTLKYNLADGFYNDGSDTAQIVGIRAIADDGTNISSYGGVTRDTSTQGTAVKGKLDSTGGPTSFDILQTTYGNCTFGGTEPDLISIPQTNYNKLWARAQVQQRFVSNDLASIGFRQGMQFNNADLVVDQHCIASSAFFWTTDFLKLFVHTKFDLAWSGWKTARGDNDLVSQIIHTCCLIASSPRHFGQIQSLT